MITWRKSFSAGKFPCNRPGFLGRRAKLAGFGSFEIDPSVLSAEASVVRFASFSIDSKDVLPLESIENGCWHLGHPTSFPSFSVPTRSFWLQ
jgi:hypothetical protein